MDAARTFAGENRVGDFEIPAVDDGDGAGIFVGDKNLVAAVRLTFQRSGAKQNCNTNEGSEWCFLENDFHAQLFCSFAKDDKCGGTEFYAP